MNAKFEVVMFTAGLSMTLFLDCLKGSSEEGICFTLGGSLSLGIGNCYAD